MIRSIPVKGSDLRTIEPLNGVFHVNGVIYSPRQTIRINWEVGNPASSGSTRCEAWRGQYEIECLTRAGYRVLSIDPCF